MTNEEAIKRYIDNAEYERTHGNLQGCLEFKQLAEWLKELNDYRERMPSYEAGYNDAKREIASSGEYERAYERGKSDAKQTRWIPVSERLPKDSGNYLIAIADSNYTKGYYYKISWFYPNNKEWSYRNAAVIAWMPIPEVYEESEGEVKHE